MIIQKILSKYFMLIMNQKSMAFTESLSYEDIVQISNFKLHYQYQYASYTFLCGYFMDLLWLHKKVIWFSRNYNLENLAVCRNYSWFNCVAAQRCRDPRFPQFHHIILCSGLIRQTSNIIFELVTRHFLLSPLVCSVCLATSQQNSKQDLLRLFTLQLVPVL